MSHRIVAVIILSLIWVGNSAFTHSVPRHLSNITPKANYVLENAKVQSSAPHLKCPAPGQYFWSEVEPGRWAFEMTKQTFVGVNLNQINKGYTPEATNPSHPKKQGLHRFFKNTMKKNFVAERIYSYYIKQGKKTQESLVQKSVHKTANNQLVYSRYKKERVNGKLVTKEVLHCPYVPVKRLQISSYQ